MRYDPESGETRLVGGVVYTIKDGIVYDSKALLGEVARRVEEAKRRATADATSQ